MTLNHIPTLTLHKCRNLQPKDEFPVSRIFIDAAKGELILSKLLRVVAGTRLVARGYWQDQEVIIKCFFHPISASRHLRRELNGLRRCQQLGLPCPQYLYAGQTVSDKHLLVLVTAFVDAPTLNDAWQKEIDHQQRLSYCFAIFKCLELLHQAGFYHSDVHFKNFLIDENKPILLDPAAIKKLPPLTSKTYRVRAFAQLLAQLPLSTEATQQALINYLCTHYSLSQEKLKALIYKFQCKRKQQYINKSLLSATENLQTQSWYQFAVIRRDYLCDALRQWQMAPDNIFHQASMLKAGDTTTVIKTTINQNNIVIKRYNIIHAWHFIRRMFRATRARNAWLSSHSLHMMGIHTPTPIALLEKRFGPLSLQSYFMYQYIEGERADKLLTALSPSEPRYQRLIHAFTGLFEQLRYCQLHHGDLKASNFVITCDDNIYLLDLDVLKYIPNTRKFERAHQRDIARFLANWSNIEPLKAAFQQALPQ